MPGVQQTFLVLASLLAPGKTAHRGHITRDPGMGICCLHSPRDPHPKTATHQQQGNGIMVLPQSPIHMYTMLWVWF